MAMLDFEATWQTQSDNYPRLQSLVEKESKSTGPADGGTELGSDDVQLRIADAPGTVSPNSTFTTTYEIENGPSDVETYRLEPSVNTSNVSVTGFNGDIQSSNLDNTPPSVLTDTVESGATTSVTVEYEVSASAIGSATITVTARDPLSSANGTVEQTVSIQPQIVPEDPTARALQLTGKQNPAELTQNDVTAAITRFSRNQSANGVDPAQDDITILITLFERN
jgi:hypothetical protein